MRHSFISLIISYLFLTSLDSNAQTSFIEGEIIYAVRIESVNPKLEKQISTGELRIKLKGNSVIKELSLSSGFKNTMLFEKGKDAYSLRKIGGEQFALQLDAEQLKKKQLKCATFTTEEYTNDIKSIANFKTERAKLICNDAPPLLIYYTKEWTINNAFLFENFPFFQYLPLAYDIKNDDGSQFHFELQKIEATPQDNGAFKIPEGYKIISYEEYKSWQH